MHFCGNFGFAQLVGNYSVSFDTHDCLYGQIDILVEMSGKVVGAKLIAGDKTEFNEVFNPFGHKVEVVASQLDISAGKQSGGLHNQHVSAFFNRHLILEVVNVAARGKHVEERIGVGSVAVVIVIAVNVSVVEVFAVVRAVLSADERVNLTACVRISSDIVRSEISFPHRHFCKFINRTHHAFDQNGII